jgi:hypothetical protein
LPELHMRRRELPIGETRGAGVARRLRGGDAADSMKAPNAALYEDFGPAPTR